MIISIDVDLIIATPNHKNVINNLMQFYIYDFSEYNSNDVEENGSFGDYPNLEEYWKKENSRFPYVVKKNDKYVGFVLVKLNAPDQQKYFSIGEFFILKKYRRQGIGKAVAHRLFNLHKGKWEVHQIESNKPAQVFWTNTIADYTSGQFTEQLENGRWIQDFKS